MTTTDSSAVIRRIGSTANKKQGSHSSSPDGTKRRKKKRKKTTQYDGQLIIFVIFVLLFVGVYGARFLLNQGLVARDPEEQQSIERRAMKQEEEKEENAKANEDPLVAKRNPSLRKHNGIVVTRDDTKQQQQEPPDEKLALKTHLGTIIIHMRPDLSQGSVDYLHRVVQQGCAMCRFYRCEPEGILQGIMDMDNPQYNTQRGPCPKGAEHVPNDCPEWDQHCGCHGPVMTRGMVAWAAGDAGGPDFFMSMYQHPAVHWGTQHTNFGQVKDEASFEVINKIFALPSKEEEGMTFIGQPVHFTLSWA